MEGEIARVLLQGTEITLRMGQGAGKVLVFLAAALKKHKTLVGDYSLKKMLRLNEPLAIGSIPHNREEDFLKYHREYGLMFHSVESKETNEWHFLIPSKDIPKFTAITQRMGLTKEEAKISADFQVDGIKGSVKEKLEQNAAILSDNAEPIPSNCVIAKMDAEAIQETIGEINRDNVEAYTADGWRTYLEMQAVMYEYSARNRELIYEAQPDATMVMSKTRWRTIGRDVDENANGIVIKRPEKKNGKTQFVDAVVYDVQDTTGKQVSFGGFFDKLTSEELNGINEAMMKKYLVEIVETQEQDAVFVPDLKKIRLREGLSSEQQFVALQREAIYGRCFKEQGAEKYMREANKFRADSLTYALCVKYGLNTEGQDFSYLDNGELEAPQELIAQRAFVLKDISDKRKEMMEMMPKIREMDVLER